MNKIEQHALVTECRSSGMKAKAWCEAKGIEYRQYVYWATKLNRESQPEPEPQLWAHVTMTQEECSTSEIRLQCGKWTISLETGFNPTLLADILKVVGTLC